jgi:hypothetical protein
MIDLSATVNHFALPYTVRRVTGADVIGADGFSTEAPTTNLTIEIHFEPTKQEDMLKLPEGKRKEQMITGLSVDELKTADVPDGTDADVIERNGRDWEVIHVERWDQGNYWKSIAERRGR